MNRGGRSNGSRLDAEIRLVIVASPDLAAPLVDALHVADIGAWMWVQAESALYLSPRVLVLLGLASEPRGNLLNRFIDGIHAEDRAAVRKLVNGRTPAGAFELRYRFMPPDGPLRWIEDRGRVERSATGELIRQGGALRDATRAVGHEQECRETDARLAALINAMPFAVWGRSGPSLTVTHQNARAVDWWGDMQGRALADAPSDLRSIWQGPLFEATTGQVVRTQTEHLRHGEVRILNEIIAPVVVEQTVTGVVGVAIDVTEEKMVERRMQDTQKLESLGGLAEGIAHDFNNLLTAILGNASLVRAEHPDVATITEPLEQIEIASRRAADLCRQMLAYAGRGRFALRALNLTEVVRASQPLLRVTVPKKATLELLLASNLPLVLADETQLRQVLINLMINAAEAIGEHAGTIRVRTGQVVRTAEELARTVFSPQLPGGAYVSLIVSDDGEGMTPATLPRIFDPFFSTRFTGRGLGLAAVAGIVRAHKGALRVESRHGKGSSFELLLPTHVGPAALPPEKTSPETHASAYRWRSHGTVLVVDDECGVRDLVRNLLERCGLTVMLAEDGGAGVAMFRQVAADIRLVLLDHTMPGLNGREALAAMRELRPEIPAILMSGYTPVDIASASSHGFLQKPFSAEALRRAVRKALGE